MHELAIAEGIIGIVKSEAQKNGFSRVLEINLMIGEYSGIVPEYITELFPTAAKGTAAEGAAVMCSVVPAEFECRSCRYSGPVDRKKACCPVCGSEDLKMTVGRDLYVDSMKVE
ncbi:MAG: hydrogenase maturation nickel metallochaperone HypA [Eubacteriales bacterium]|nr:hydrogenase maturation nickel metallochaperone HypA [Eubacteriales bacterium]